jgi:hypothetical protein
LERGFLGEGLGMSREPLIPFRGSRAKIARAVEHLETLTADVAAYIARKPIVLRI